MTDPDLTSQEQVNKSIGMCRLHGLHNAEATLRALSAELLSVCQREAAMIARYDAKLDAAEAKLKEAVEFIEHVENGHSKDYTDNMESAARVLAAIRDMDMDK